MRDIELENKIKNLIDDLKAVCNTYGLSGDAGEYKIISQSFLYKFLNDKFIHDVCEKDSSLAKANNLQEALLGKTEDEYSILMALLGGGTAKLKPTHLISYLYAQQNVDEFYKVFNETLNDIAMQNSDTFSVHTAGGKNVLLFDSALFNAITDEDKRDDAARAVINKLSNDRFDFVEAFGHGFDFFSTIFEYLIKDYNANGGGTYAEYYTPHSVARIIAKILVDNDSELTSQKVLDPSAGSGTLLMNIAHEIGTDKCSVYSQDISQKSSNLLRLNLILNNLSPSISNVVEGNTITDPAHTNYRGKFDFIVSNPPFKVDFSEYRDEIDTENNRQRFFAGIPAIPNKDKDSMSIYELFIQHILWMLSSNGKAAIVVPTGFLTASVRNDKIAVAIRQELIDKKILKGVVSMPSNIFANTGTNVSVLFIDKANTHDECMLMDASKLGTKVKEGKNKKTVLSNEEIELIINTFLNKTETDELAAMVPFEKIKERDYSLGAGQYFEVKMPDFDLSKEEVAEKLKAYKQTLSELMLESNELDKSILNSINEVAE